MSTVRTRRGASIAAAAAGLGLTAVALLPATSSAAPLGSRSDRSVTLCHRTDSMTNPYVTITVDPAGAYDGHYLEHTGDEWSPDHAKEPKWGDVIPPFTYDGHTYSLNWDAAGQAMFAAGCAVPGSVDTPPPVGTTPPPVEGTPQTDPSTPATDPSTPATTPAPTTPAAPSTPARGVDAVSTSRSATTQAPGPIPAAVDAGRVAVTRPSDDSGLLLAAGIALLGGGGAGLVTVRRRTASSRTH